MIKGPQIEALSAYQDHEFHYITAITKPQIETLLQVGEIQLELFDQVLAEVQTAAGVRYVLRRNPTRAAEMKRVREDKYQALGQVVEEHNRYLQEHPRATLAVARRHLEAKSQRLKITTGSSSRRKSVPWSCQKTPTDSNSSNHSMAVMS